MILDVSNWNRWWRQKYPQAAMWWIILGHPVGKKKQWSTALARVPRNLGLNMWSRKIHQATYKVSSHITYQPFHRFSFRPALFSFIASHSVTSEIIYWGFLQNKITLKRHKFYKTRYSTLGMIEINNALAKHSHWHSMHSFVCFHYLICLVLWLLPSSEYLRLPAGFL